MSEVSSLFQLIQYAGCDYCVFDTGRRVSEINKETFEQFEKGLIPYPTPIQQSARFALVYWPLANPSNPFIWFLNLPLDEESQVIAGSRNHFVAIIQEAMGQSFAENSNEEQQKLPDNPYIKLPDSNKIAVVNAAVKRKLNQDTSTQMQACLDYLMHEKLENWRTLSVQGWADLLSKLDDPKIQSLFDKHFFDLPDEMLQEITPLIEHHRLSRALNNRLLKTLKSTSEFNVQSIQYLRCISAYSDLPPFIEWLTEQLQSNKENLTDDFYALIAGRCWNALQDPLVLSMYLENIAELKQASFSALFKDLVSLPAIRRPILAMMQNPNALIKTRKAVTTMIREQYGTTH
ncbi:DUF3549 family protein [Catenovulum sediminis]|uniref:DUF3549 family protein n=1 Tax=Catenovulum sediminis TaxID=1740262 RepID=A0ABV1RJ33_9ALTE|nr:DUF3549 family protein [Catenovulum sediminis]